MDERVADGDRGVDAMGRGAGRGGLGFWRAFCEALDDDEADGFLLGEVAVYVDNTDGEEAGFVAERCPGAVVDVDGAMWSEAVEDPEVAIADGVRDGKEAGV